MKRFRWSGAGCFAWACSLLKCNQKWASVTKSGQMWACPSVTKCNQVCSSATTKCNHDQLDCKLCTFPRRKAVVSLFLAAMQCVCVDFCERRKGSEKQRSTMVSSAKWALGRPVGQRWLVVGNGQEQQGAELRKEVATPATHTYLM